MKFSLKFASGFSLFAVSRMPRIRKSASMANSPVNLVIVTKILSHEISRGKEFFYKTKAL